MKKRGRIQGWRNDWCEKIYTTGISRMERRQVLIIMCFLLFMALLFCFQMRANPGHIAKKEKENEAIMRAAQGYGSCGWICIWCVRSDTLGSYNCGNALTHTYIYMYVMCRNSKFALAMARRKLYIRFPQSWNENVTMLASQPGKPYFSGGWWKLIRMRYYMCTYASTTFIKT